MDNKNSRNQNYTSRSDVKGVMETDDGATIYFDYRGYRRSYPAGKRQALAIGTQLGDDDRYRLLNSLKSLKAKFQIDRHILKEYLLWQAS